MRSILYYRGCMRGRPQRLKRVDTLLTRLCAWDKWLMVPRQKARPTLSHVIGLERRDGGPHLTEVWSRAKSLVGPVSRTGGQRKCNWCCCVLPLGDDISSGADSLVSNPSHKCLWESSIVQSPILASSLSPSYSTSQVTRRRPCLRSPCTTK